MNLIDRSCHRVAVMLALVLLMLTTACSTKTTLTLTSDNHVSVDEIIALTGLLDASVNTIDESDGQIEVKFEKELSDIKQERLKSVLDRIVRIKPNTQIPSLKLKITEDDPDVLKVLGVSANAPEIDLNIRPSAGERVLFSAQANRFIHTEICAWRIPCEKELPTLTYKGKFDNTDTDSTKDALTSLLKTIQDVMGPMTAKHKLIANEKIYQPIVDKLEMDSPKYLFLSFGSETKDNRPTLWGNSATTAEKVDFIVCSKKIIENSEDAFFQGFMFPTLSRYLTSYQFDTTIL